MNNNKITKKASNSKKIWNDLVSKKSTRKMIQNSWKHKDSKEKFSDFLRKKN